jgi:hypothetical protein
MDGSTDVWFRSRLPLPALAAELGAAVTEIDSEDYWEWVVGDVAGITINITRTHTKSRAKTDTRIFRVDSDSRAFPDTALRHLLGQLERLKVDPVHVGTWVYRDGNNFDQVVHTSISRASAQVSP